MTDQPMGGLHSYRVGWEADKIARIWDGTFCTVLYSNSRMRRCLLYSCTAGAMAGAHARTLGPRARVRVLGPGRPQVAKEK
jgi:hypothetical protein